MEERIKQALRDPNLQDGVLQRLRDDFGADSQVASDNTIVLMFAGMRGPPRAIDTRGGHVSGGWLLHWNLPGLIMHA
jgi:hypothetical protein